MSLPANDAFTLAAHSDRRPSRSRSITRSPSPKISFSSPQLPNGDMKRRPSIRQRKSKGSGATESVVTSTLAEIEETLEVERNLLNGDAKTEKKGKKVDWEIPRKLLHSSIGFLTLYLYASHGSRLRVVVVLAGALCVIVPADVLRLRSSRFERIYERCLGFLMRESEKNHTNGVIWYIIGVIFCLTLYPQDISIISIMLLSWADTAASTFGRAWGSLTPPLPARTPILGLPLAPRKSLAGFLAATITGACIVFSFWSWLAPAVGDPLPSWDWETGVAGEAIDTSVVGAAVRGWLREAGFQGVNNGGLIGLAIISTVAGLLTGVSEALDLGSLDDNLTLPIISGGCIWGFLKLLSWFSS
ncbi:hypothetical protein BV25DRAFT_1827062 [Artomyces pyxidatus]|uniref:Uncharacterized protein n=1 Tax=Artomyces pyxidatus TaxID=48021 RepID=A0ACB8SYB3_9AGAM|nr:hypothetical protein BV25DRAFT_1827062 [Artomyces pyxidatus]